MEWQRLPWVQHIAWPTLLSVQRVLTNGTMKLPPTDVWYIIWEKIFEIMAYGTCRHGVNMHITLKEQCMYWPDRPLSMLGSVFRCTKGCAGFTVWCGHCGVFIQAMSPHKELLWRTRYNDGSERTTRTPIINFKAKCKVCYQSFSS